jgi:hypothetical protein
VKPNIRIAPSQPTTVDIHVIHLPRGVKTPLSAQPSQSTWMRCGAAHASVADESDDQVASSKPNDFKDFGEQ